MRRIKKLLFCRRAWITLSSNSRTLNRFVSQQFHSGYSGSLIHIGAQNQGFADEATNAQIDTLILDNRKKLNQIIGNSHLSPSKTPL